MNEILQKISKYPTHIVLGGNDTTGGLEQNVYELSHFCLFLKEKNIKTYTEVGIAKGLLLKFMRDEMNLEVQGITLEKLDIHQGLPVVYGDSKEPSIVEKSTFCDLYFIDGDHSYNGVKSDYENYKSKCKFMAFHDILGYRHCEGVAKFWEELKRIYKHWEFIDSTPAIASGIGVIEL